MRTNLKEKAKNIKMNYSNEMKRVENLFGLSKVIKYYRDNDWTGLYPQYATIQEFFGMSMFISYPHAGTFINIQDMRISLGVSEEDINNNDINTLLDYFEFVMNVVLYFFSNYKNYNIEFDTLYLLLSNNFLYLMYIFLLMILNNIWCYIIVHFLLYNLLY